MRVRWPRFRSPSPARCSAQESPRQTPRPEHVDKSTSAPARKSQGRCWWGWLTTSCADAFGFIGRAWDASGTTSGEARRSPWLQPAHRRRERPRRRALQRQTSFPLLPVRHTQSARHSPVTVRGGAARKIGKRYRSSHTKVGVGSGAVRRGRREAATRVVHAALRVCARCPQGEGLAETSGRAVEFKRPRCWLAVSAMFVPGTSSTTLVQAASALSAAGGSRLR